MMHRRALPMLALIPWALAAWAQSAAPLQNADFETAVGVKPAGWSFGDFRTGGQPAYSPTAGHRGTAAVGITVATTTQRGAWQQTLAANSARLLLVEAWYRSEAPAGGAAPKACVRMTYLKPGKGWDYLSDQSFTAPPAPDGSQFRALYTLPPETDRVAVELFNFFQPGTVWWDDIVVRPPTNEEVTKMLGQALDRQPDENEVHYAPADGDTVGVNPPAFVWLPAAGMKRYLVQYSQDPEFAPAATTTERDLDLTVFTPLATLRPGVWYWRYGFEAGDQPVLSKVRRFTIPADAVAFPRPAVDELLAHIPTVRPRIYFTPAKVAEIRADAQGKYRAMIRSVVSAADKQLGQPLYPEPPMLPKDPQERSKAYLVSFQTMRPWTGGMENCALAYICTGDRKYAEEAKRRLLHFATWDVNGGSSLQENDEAAMDIAMRGPRTFDWIYDTLTDAERATCQEFLRQRLVQINEAHRRMPFDSRPYESHSGRRIGFMVEGSLVFAHELPEAQTWLDYYSRLLWSVYPVWGGDDGGWHEGIGYWNAYLSMMTMVIAELDRLGIPWKNKPFLHNTGWFGLYCGYVGRKTSSFGDGEEGAANVGQLMYHLSSIYDNPYFRWQAEQSKAGAGSGPLGFTLYKPELPAKPPSDLPQARVFPRAGWVAMHSNMADPANNVLLLMHDSPYGSVSHNHANQNAFVLEAFGEPLAISSGYYQRYGCPHHAGWTWQTKAHNSLLVDGEGQVPRSFASKGFVTEFANTDQFAYTTGDATAAYGGRLKRFLRHVLFARPDYFVVYDEIEAAKPATYQWLLHARSQFQLDPEQLALVSAQGQARLRVQFLLPGKLEFSQTDQFDVPPEKPDSPNQWHFRASTTAPAPTMGFLTVLLPYREGDEGKLPACKSLAATGGVVAQVGRDLIAWKAPGAKVVQAGQFSSEADLVALRLDQTGQASAVFVQGKGLVRLAGAVVAKP